MIDKRYIKQLRREGIWSNLGNHIRWQVSIIITVSLDVWLHSLTNMLGSLTTLGSRLGGTTLTSQPSKPLYEISGDELLIGISEAFKQIDEIVKIYEEWTLQ